MSESKTTKHGSPELDDDAAKLIALGADPGLTFDEIDFGFSKPPTGPEEILFMLWNWGNMNYDDGSGYAHDMLLKYRSEIQKAVEGYYNVRI